MANLYAVARAVHIGGRDRARNRACWPNRRNPMIEHQDDEKVAE
jgi:hypothetical protein